MYESAEAQRVATAAHPYSCEIDCTVAVDRLTAGALAGYVGTRREEGVTARFLRRAPRLDGGEEARGGAAGEEHGGEDVQQHRLHLEENLILPRQVLRRHTRSAGRQREGVLAAGCRVEHDTREADVAICGQPLCRTFARLKKWVLAERGVVPVVEEPVVGVDAEERTEVDEGEGCIVSRGAVTADELDQRPCEMA